MKLSIIVPVYNMAGGGKLTYCMESLLAQTLQDFEIIAVDDCSTDDSWRILREYERKHADKVRSFRHEVNKKQGGARNTGLEHAAGEWVGFIDSDDWIAPKMYEKLLKKAEETGADVVGCDYNLTSHHGMQVGKIVQNNTLEQTGVLDDKKYASLLMRAGSMVIKVYRREIIEKYHLRFPENTFYEDNCAGPIWMLHFNHFEKVEEPLYYYYQHEASTVHFITEERCRNRMDTALQLLEQCHAYGYDEKYHTELEFRFTELYYYNTLFSYVSGGNYVPGAEKVRISFLRELKRGMKEHFPEFQKNPYYLENYDAEQKRLVTYHMKSPCFFLVYYRLLQAYRRFRYGKK